MNDRISTRGCLHCGADCAAEFCCSGCQAVFLLLRQNHLEGYYDYRQQVGGRTEPAPVALPANAEFDADAFRSLYCRDEPDGLRSAELSLTGMHCAACVWLIERLPRLVPEVHTARVDFSRGRVRVVWDPARLALSEVARALARLGYVPGVPRGAAQERARQRELRGLLTRIGIAGACAGNVMLMALALYSAGTGSLEMDAATRRFFQIGSWLLSLPALAAGSLFFRGAWGAIKARTAHMDVPIALGISVALGWATWTIFAGHGELYLDSITTLIFLLLIGRYLQRRHQLSGAEAAELLHGVTPSWAQIVRDSSAPAERVEIDSVTAGDLLRVDSGELIPVDGVVESGTSALDMALINGESLPVEVRPGSDVLAGCLNAGGVLLVRATSTRQRSRVASLLHSVEQALLDRTPLATQADRVSGVFTQLILALALGTGLFWWFVAPARAVPNALSLLIVACPCALAMATPLALNVAARQAAQLKILFFRAQALERLAVPTDLILDKTGTLTEGRLQLTRWDGDAAFQQVARAAESSSRHPIARALRDGSPLGSTVVTDLHESLGQGVSGRYLAQSLWVGSEAFVRKNVVMDAAAEEWLSQGPAGASPLLVAWDGAVRAVGWFEDSLRPNVSESLRVLRSLGHRLTVLSGDHPEVVECIAQRLREQSGDPDLFTQVHGGVDAESKQAHIKKLSGQGRTVVMVGDGVNDAAALAAADVGIAVHGAAEASRLSADVYLAAAGVADLVTLFSGARRTLVVIRRGMAFALVYNLFGVGMAMAGLLHPLVAAVLMPLSSLTVVTNAYRSRMFALQTEPRP